MGAIGDNSFIGLHTHFGVGVCIQNYVSLFFEVYAESNCILYNGVIIGPRVHLDEGVIVHENSVICYDVQIGSKTILGKNDEISFKVTIGSNVKLFDHVKVFDHVNIGNLTILDEYSMVHANVESDAYVGRGCLIAKLVPKGAIIFDSVEFLAVDVLNEMDIAFAYPTSRQLYIECLTEQFENHE